MKLIGLCGYSQVGKDTAFRAIKKLLRGKDVTRRAFADKLKKDVKDMLKPMGFSVDFSNEDDKKQFRTMLVAWGKQMREFESNYWIYAVEDEILREEDIEMSDYVTITDVRYTNEIEMIYEHGGMVIRLERQGYGPANEEEKMSFALIGKEYPDLPVVYNDGTPEELAKKILEVAK